MYTQWERRRDEKKCSIGLNHMHLHVAIKFQSQPVHTLKYLKYYITRIIMIACIVRIQHSLSSILYTHQALTECSNTSTLRCQIRSQLLTRSLINGDLPCNDEVNINLRVEASDSCEPTTRHFLRYLFESCIQENYYSLFHFILSRFES